MNNRLTIENQAAGEVLCTLELSGIGSGQALKLTMCLPKDAARTTSQLELQVLEKARDLIAEMCSKHPASKRG